VLGIRILEMDTWRKRRADLFSKLADVSDEFDDEWAKGKSDDKHHQSSYLTRNPRNR
jgi:hypothetical protein